MSLPILSSKDAQQRLRRQLVDFRGFIAFMGFFKVAATQEDLLFLELQLHLSHVRQMYSQPIHLKHKLILCIQIKRGKGRNNRDSAEKSRLWHRVLSLQPSYPDHLCFQPYLSYKTRSWLHMVRPVLSESLCSGRQQAARIRVQTFPKPVYLERVGCPFARLLWSRNGARLWFLSAAPGVPERSPIQELFWPNAT